MGSDDTLHAHITDGTDVSVWPSAYHSLMMARFPLGADRRRDAPLSVRYSDRPQGHTLTDFERRWGPLSTQPRRTGSLRRAPEAAIRPSTGNFASVWLADEVATKEVRHSRPVQAPRFRAKPMALAGVVVHLRYPSMRQQPGFEPPRLLNRPEPVRLAVTDEERTGVTLNGDWRPRLQSLHCGSTSKWDPGLDHE